MPLKPTGNRLLVQPITASSIVGGIHLPDAYEAKGNRRAKIVAVGAAVTEPGLTFGAEVLFSPFGGTEIRDDALGQLYLLDADSVFGILS